MLLKIGNENVRPSGHRKAVTEIETVSAFVVKLAGLCTKPLARGGNGNLSLTGGAVTNLGTYKNCRCTST